MKKVALIFILLLYTIVSMGQSTKALLVLNNYLIPTNRKEVFIGRFHSPTEKEIILVEDTAQIFKIDKCGNLSLKKGAILTAESPFRYKIIVEYNDELRFFELVKDDFIRNKVIAHRGAWKNQNASQNSLKSLTKAIEIGCEATEFDVWLSSDNVVLLSHDPKIGGKIVEDTPAKELFKVELKDGDHLPSLEEYINCIKQQNKTRLVLEVKASQKGKERSEAAAEASVGMVHRMKAQAWVDYITFSYDAAKRIRELDPTASIQYLEADKTLDELQTANITGIDYHYSHFIKDPALTKKANRAGLSTNAWTVNKEDDMKILLSQGVDYITTDEPELLLKLIKD